MFFNVSVSIIHPNIIINNDKIKGCTVHGLMNK